MYIVRSVIYNQYINEFCETYAQALDAKAKTEKWGGTATIEIL